MLILRAIAIEFRSKETMLWWRKLWDITYSVSSTLVGFTLGVVLGNIVIGIPIDENMIYKGSLLDILIHMRFLPASPWWRFCIAWLCLPCNENAGQVGCTA